VQEAGFDLYAPLDLKIGMCKMVVAAPAELASRKNSGKAQRGNSGDGHGENRGWVFPHMRIASKYPAIAKAYADSRGLSAEIVTLTGSIELGPVTGLCDCIIDITQSGETLRQNHLVVVDELTSVSSLLIVNLATIKTKFEEVKQVVANLGAVVARA